MFSFFMTKPMPFLANLYVSCECRFVLFNSIILSPHSIQHIFTCIHLNCSIVCLDGWWTHTHTHFFAVPSFAWPCHLPLILFEYLQFYKVKKDWKRWWERKWIAIESERKKAKKKKRMNILRRDWREITPYTEDRAGVGRGERIWSHNMCV